METGGQKKNEKKGITRGIKAQREESVLKIRLKKDFIEKR